MKHQTIHRSITGGLLVLAAILMMAPMPALAIGTAANTPIANTPTVQYSVGAVAQPIYTAPTTTFVVDTKVIFTVQDNNGGAPVNVAPSSTNRVLNFQLSNESNASVRFLLTAMDLDSGETATLGGNPYNDSGINTTAIQAFVDGNANGSYDAGEQYVTVASGVAAVTVNVLVYSNIPAAASGQIIAIRLTATAVDGAGAALLESGADTANVNDIVLADGAGTDDAARSGTFTDRHAYRIASAVVSVSKTATTIWDPYNYGAGGAIAPGNPKAIPGALVQYEITIANDATATDSAIISTLTDTLNGNVTIDPDLLAAADAAVLGATSAAGSGFRVTYISANGRTVPAQPLYYTTTSSADGLDHNGVNPGGAITATLATLLPADGGAGYAAGELKPGDSVTIRFNVIVQ